MATDGLPRSCAGHLPRSRSLSRNWSLGPSKVLDLRWAYNDIRGVAGHLWDGQRRPVSIARGQQSRWNRFHTSMSMRTMATPVPTSGHSGRGAERGGCSDSMTVAGLLSYSYWSCRPRARGLRRLLVEKVNTPSREHAGGHAVEYTRWQSVGGLSRLSAKA
jgi:hypothetical protein